MRRQVIINCSIALFFVMLLSFSQAASARSINNKSGKYNGLYIAEVVNSKTKEVFKGVEVELQGNFITIRFSKEDHRTLRCDDLFDRHYEIEATAYDFQNKHNWIVRLDTSTSK